MAVVQSALAKGVSKHSGKYDSLTEVIVSLSFVMVCLCGFMCVILFDLSTGSELRTLLLTIR